MFLGNEATLGLPEFQGRYLWRKGITPAQVDLGLELIRTWNW